MKVYSPVPARHAIAAAVALLTSTALVAQTSTPSATLPEVTVSGRPILEANRVDAFGSVATEVTDVQIRDLNALDLASALRRTPGVTITRFNSVGSFDGAEGGAVFVRGIGASRPGSEVKTYIDGVPFYTPTGNHPLLDLLPVHGMERITVYKGPQPQTFGNNFAAIDLRPKHAANEGLEADARLAAGSFSTAVEEGSVAFRRGDFDVAVAQTVARSAGHRLDGDGRISNILARAGVRIDAHWAADVTLLYADNKASDPGQEGDPSTKGGKFDTRGSLASVSVAHDHGGARGSLKLYANEGSSNLYGAADPTQLDRRSDFRLQGLRWREAVSPWTGGEVLVGLDVDQIRGSTTFPALMMTLFEDLDLRLTSPYAALSQTFAIGGGWELTPSAGARYYKHNVFGNSTAPHFGLVARQGETLELRANAARGFNHAALDAPLLNFLVEAAAPGVLSPDAWRSLRPERMDHVEVGANWKWDARGGVDVAVFDDRFSGRYLFAMPPDVAQPELINLGDYSVRGAEVSWQQQLNEPFSLFVGATFLNPSRADIPYAPRRLISAGVVWREGPWRVSLDAQAQSAMLVLSRQRLPGAPTDQGVPGFAVANLRTSYALPLLGPRGEVFIAIENLTDRRYAFRPGYPMPGLSGRVGVNLSL